MTSDLSAPPALQPYILLAKNATGRAAADLVVQATQAPGSYVFAELLECPNIQKLAGSPESAPYLALLEIFAYGSYTDYKGKLLDYSAVRISADVSDTARASSLPALNDKQLEKLRQLSLINIASRGNQYLTYTSLLAELELPSVRVLEDLIISAIYAELLEAKLDTKQQRVEVSSTAGRDVAPNDIGEMVAMLKAWSEQCQGVLEDLDQQMRDAKFDAHQQRREKDDYEKALKAKWDKVHPEEKLSQGKGKRVISDGTDEGRGYDEDEMDIDESGPFGGDGSHGGANSTRARAKGRFGNLMSGKKRR